MTNVHNGFILYYLSNCMLTIANTTDINYLMLEITIRGFNELTFFILYPLVSILEIISFFTVYKNPFCKQFLWKYLVKTINIEKVQLILFFFIIYSRKTLTINVLLKKFHSTFSLHFLTPSLSHCKPKICI